MSWLKKISSDLFQDDRELEWMVDLLSEEASWTKTMQQEGSLVKHDQEGWIGTIVRPVNNPTDRHSRVLVEHEIEDGLMGQRFYSPLELSPALRLV